FYFLNVRCILTLPYLHLIYVLNLSIKMGIFAKIMPENQYFDYKDQFSEAEKKRASKSLWYYSWIRFKRNKLAMAGLILVVCLILIAITAVILAPYDQN